MGHQAEDGKLGRKGATPMQHTNLYGYDRIAKVVGQRIRELDGLPAYSEDYGHNPIVWEGVWITTSRGEIMGVDLHRGETLEDRVTYYTRRGWTDDRCCLFTPAK
jgi:hypothetical protein